MGLIDLSGTPEVAALDFNMARDMAEALHGAYPHHLWAVTCEGDKGIATIRNLGLSGNWGVILKLSEISTASDWKKKIIMAGGEVLERYHLRRGIADHAAISSLKCDFAGRITEVDKS